MHSTRIQTFSGNATLAQPARRSNSSRSRTAGVLAITIFTLTVVSARADFTPAIDFSGGFVDMAGANYAIGYSFATGATPVTIDALGLFAASGETVRVYVSGTSVDLASATVSAANSSSPSPEGNSYFYTPITPLLLLPNTTYSIVSDYTALDPVQIFTTAVANTSDISYVGAVGSQTDSHPTSDDAGGAGPYFGPSFEIAAVPEPSTFALCAAGAIAIGWRRRRRGRAAV